MSWPRWSELRKELDLDIQNKLYWIRWTKAQQPHDREWARAMRTLTDDLNVAYRVRRIFHREYAAGRLQCEPGGHAGRGGLTTDR